MWISVHLSEETMGKHGDKTRVAVVLDKRFMAATQGVSESRVSVVFYVSLLLTLPLWNKHNEFLSFYN